MEKLMNLKWDKKIKIIHDLHPQFYSFLLLLIFFIDKKQFINYSTPIFDYARIQNDANCNSSHSANYSHAIMNVCRNSKRSKTNAELT